jgi:NAD(P)-dependent dehydrogenase (short-subunit alcohol dehydrogenase family)
MTPLAGKTALVTGANRGIGFEIARQLGQAGATVLVVSRNAGLGTEAVEKLHAEGILARALVADVSHQEDVVALREAVPALHVLVNNAGVIDEALPTWDLPVAEWDTVLATNLRGPFLMCRAFAPMMRTGGHGRIVNVSSGMGSFADGLDGGHPAYRVSKAALNALTQNLAHELHGTGVLVNAMCPGWVQTRMGGTSAPRTVEQGADTALYLSTLPANGPTGKFFRDRAEIAW